MDRPTVRRRSILILTLLASLGGGGCGMVPQRRLDESRLRIQVLQAENEQLRDVALSVRSQNRDLAARSLDESRKLRALEETNRRLEKSVLAYQDETKRMAALLDQLRAQVRLAVADDTTVSLRDELQRVPERFPDVRYDAKSLTFQLPARRLFDPTSGELSEDAGRWLDAIGAELRAAAQSEPRERWVLEVGPVASTDSGVRRASDGPDDAAASARFRQHKLRARVESASGLDRAFFDVRPDGPTDEITRASAGDAQWVELRVVPAPANGTH